MILFNFVFYSLACLVFMVLFRKREKAVARAGIVAYTIMTVIWLWAVLSFREPAGDPWRYMLGLNYIAQFSFVELLSYDRTPFGFALLNWLTALISTNSVFFFSVIYAFCVIPLYLAFRERVNKTDAAVLMMLYLLYPFYISYLASGFKQGIAFGFMLWGLSSMLDRQEPRWAKGIFLLFLTTLFHTSFWLVIVSFLGWLFFFKNKSLSWTLSVLAISILLAVTGLVEPIVTTLIPQTIIDSLGFNEYFDDTFLSESHYASLNYKTGFRIDFTLLTLTPLILVLFLRRKHVVMRTADDLLKVYCLLASAYFILCFIPFSDRIASFSWFLIPYLIFTKLSLLKSKVYRENFVFLIIILYPVLMLTYTKSFFQ